MFLRGGSLLFCIVGIGESLLGTFIRGRSSLFCPEDGTLFLRGGKLLFCFVEIGVLLGTFDRG